MSAFTGRHLRLPDHRRTIADLLRLAVTVPAVTVQRTMPLGEVATSRSRCRSRIGWPALMAQAFGRVSARHPELRQLFLSLPREHLYQCERTVGTLAVERHDAGGPSLHFVPFRSPERWFLYELQSTIDRYKSTPLSELGALRRCAVLAASPTPLRRLMWWLAYHGVPRWRAKHFGTFGISAVAAWGAETLAPLSPLTSTVTYSPIHGGAMRVRLTFDHRVIDGAPAARYLAELEDELRGPGRAELERWARSPEPWRAAVPVAL